MTFSVENIYSELNFYENSLYGFVKNKYPKNLNLFILNTYKGKE